MEWRGIASEIVSIGLAEPVPSDLDIYLIGGGEDGTQTLAVEHLQNPGLQQAANGSASVLAVCAGLQILGEWYEDANGNRVEGVGALDVRTTMGAALVNSCRRHGSGVERLAYWF